MSPLISNKDAETKIHINFAHANGFPSASYKKLFANLPSTHQVFALDKFAHNPAYPLVDNWDKQVDELINFVEQNNNGNEKVVALGHSFGALISYMSVCRRPDLFSSLIMLDPPLITGLARYVFRFAKRNRLIDKVTPAGITKLRKKKWHRDIDLHAYFSKKKLFTGFDPDCIQDYIEAVMEMHNDHWHLSFDVEVEANIFRTIPHNLPSYAGKLNTPSTLITGKGTDVCVPALRKPFLRANPQIKHIEFAKGKHMFPLEYPVEVAELIASILPQ